MIFGSKEPNRKTVLAHSSAPIQLAFDCFCQNFSLIKFLKKQNFSQIPELDLVYFLPSIRGIHNESYFLQSMMIIDNQMDRFRMK